MDTKKTGRMLGFAFVLQFVTSLTSGAVIKPLWYVSGNMEETLIRIAGNASLFRFGILLDMVTAMGVIFLGAMLYASLKRQNQGIAATAFAFYILEGAVLAASKMASFILLRFSDVFVNDPAMTGLPVWAQTVYEAMEFTGSSLHMLVFCAGAMFFYYLLIRSGKLPRWLSLWGFIALLPLAVGSVLQMFSLSLPVYFYVPYVPFELVAGLWILVRGVPRDE